MRILVVDDHRNSRDALAIGLRLLGVDVQTAGSGADALACLAGTACDWIVCDVRMPGMSGLELAGAVRQTRPDIGLILMTAHDVSGDERRRIAQLKADLLIKPVTAESLAARCATTGAPVGGTPARRECDWRD